LDRAALEPQLHTVRAEEMPLSAEALLGLMREILALGKHFRFRALGWSMAPFICDGDVICVSPLAAAGPGIGDVVAFIAPETERLVVHRVVARRGAAYLIQGDNVRGVTDGTVLAGNILGRVTRITRNGREVRRGLGPERRLIAVFSRAGWLSPVRSRLAALLRPLARRFVL